MKALTFTLMMLVGFFSYAEDSSINQDGSVTNNGAMNLYGVNSSNSNVDVAYDSYGGGVRCAVPVFDFGASQTYMPEGQKIPTIYTGISLPFNADFGVDSCEKAARLQNQLKTWELNENKIVAERRAEMHKVKIEQERAIAAQERATAGQYQAELVKLCMRLHGGVSASPDIVLSQICNKFAPITKDHHAGQPPINTALIPETHKRISPNRQDRE